MLKNKQVLKKGFLLLTVGATILSLAACDKDTDKKVDPTPTPGGDGGHQIEDVQTTVGEIVSDYIQEKGLSGIIQSEHLECLQEIVGKAVNNLDLNSFKTTYNDGDAVAIYKYKNADGKTQLGSTHFDVSSMVEYYLNSNLDELLLMGINEFGDTSVSESLLDKYETRLAAAMDKILNDINTAQYSSVQKNNYAEDCGISDSLKSEVLKYIESDNAKNKILEPVTFGAPREDGSVIITGVDKQGKLCECYFKLADGKDLTANEFYQQVASGTWDTFTTRRIETDLPYSQPAVEEQKVMIPASDIFEEVFEGFQVADLKNLLNGIAKEWIPQYDYKFIFAEFNDEKTEAKLYTEFSDVLGCPHLVTLNLTGDVVKDIWNYQSLKDFSEFKTELLQEYGEVEEGSLDEAQLKQELTSERQKYEKAEKNIQDFDGSKIKETAIITGGQTKFDNINEYGEKLLEKEQDAQVIATYLTDWSGKGFDIGHNFNTGYVRDMDACVLYEKAGQIYIYKSDVEVPHYTDSTKQSLYQSILDGKYVALNENTTQIDMKNTLSFIDDGAATNYQYEDDFELPVDLYFEDNRR